MDLYKRIQDLKKTKKIKTATIAHALDMEQSNYVRVEKKGAKLTYEQIESISNALGVSVKEFLFDEKEEQKDDRSKKMDFLEREFSSLTSNVIILKKNVDNFFSMMLNETIHGLLTMNVQLEGITAEQEYRDIYETGNHIYLFYALKNKKGKEKHMKSEKAIFDTFRVLDSMKKCENDEVFFNNYGSILHQYFTQMVDEYNYDYLFHNNLIDNPLLKKMYRVYQTYVEKLPIIFNLNA